MGSQLREPFVDVLTNAMTHVPTLTAAQQADVMVARDRLAAWTSLETPEGTTATDATEIADSIATSIFNAIFTRVGPIGLGDEATAMSRGSFNSARVARFIEDSFAGTPDQQSRLEIYWDNLTTAGTVETKEQAVVRAAVGGIEFLAPPPRAGGPREGWGAPHNRGARTGAERRSEIYWDNLPPAGRVETKEQAVVLATLAAFEFLRATLGTDVSMWRWGRLHTVRFDSVLPTVGTDLLSIPADGDPTYPNGFPRHGDFGSVDPGQFGLWNTTDFRFGSGASQRLVVEMTETGPIAFNALPGGQSIDPNSPHKMDEALLWIRNEQPRMAFQETEIREAAERCLVIRPR